MWTILRVGWFGCLVAVLVWLAGWPVGSAGWLAGLVGWLDWNDIGIGLVWLVGWLGSWFNYNLSICNHEIAITIL